MSVSQANLAVTDADVIKSIIEVLKSGRFIGGSEVEQFAKRWAEYCDAKHCVPTASGSAALEATIRAIASPGDAILVPAYSFAATASVVHSAHCRPVYCDVTPCGLLDWKAAANMITEFDGVLLVHLYGQLCDIPDSVPDWAFYVIEDACQAHGLQLSDTSDAACYSFYPSKNLGAIGDAGAVVTNRDDVANFIAQWINYGDPPGHKYVHSLIGTNARMDAIQAAYLNCTLSRLDDDNTVRTKVASVYKKWGVPTIATAEPNVWHLYPILADDPDRLIEVMLEDYGVEVGRHYPYILPDVMRDGYPGRSFPVAERLAKHVVTLPIGPHIRVMDATFVAESLREVAQLDDDMWRMRV